GKLSPHPAGADQRDSPFAARSITQRWSVWSARHWYRERFRVRGLEWWARRELQPVPQARSLPGWAREGTLESIQARSPDRAAGQPEARGPGLPAAEGPGWPGQGGSYSG